MPSAKITLPRSASTREIRSHGSGNSSAKSPKPGMSAVHSHSLGLNSRISTAGTSPGRALDVDGPADRIDVIEVQLGDIL